jgi:pSer/pThr/pTyr-binding forkhead associated (FHA) protein
MWKLSIEDDQGQSTIVQLVRSEYSVGRTEDNSIRLTERNISRRHAKLLKQGAAWFLNDLGSYNGCFVNGLRVVDNHPVALGDLIQLGDYRLELLCDDDVAVASPQPAPSRRRDTLSTTLNLAAQTDRLVMVVGPTPGREYMLAHAQQRVGRGEECDICVNHSSVSRWHADLHYVGSSRYEIIDHGSSNGIRINGVELRRGLLDARDLVELGDIVLKFIPAGQVYRPSPEESKQLAALLGVDVDAPAPGRVERFGILWRSLSGATRWGIILLVLAVVVLLTLSKVHPPRSPSQTTLEGAATGAQPYFQALARAKQFAAEGRMAAAHDSLASIPSSSNLRNDAEFIAIERRWGEALIHDAEVSSSSDEKRRLLSTVSAAPTLDAQTRRKAADALEALQSGAVDVNALPSSSASPDTDTTTPLPSEEDSTNRAQLRASLNTPPPAVDEPNSPVRQQAKRQQRNATQQRPAGGTPAVKPSNGVEQNASELATSGNLESLKAARDALRRKVAAGAATDREVRLLRALCRQLGDTTCPR